MTMNVLVVENETDVADVAKRELRDKGHNVLSCHEPGTAPFPCLGVANPTACPLRLYRVDVALDVRAGTRAQPALGEDGARCALVHRIPLVVAGTSLFDPFDDYATRTIEHTDDVVDACDDAANAPIAALGRRATAALNDVIHPSATPSARVEVTRRAGRLTAHASGADALTQSERSRAAVRILAALREVDPYAAGIDVAWR